MNFFASPELFVGCDWSCGDFLAGAHSASSRDSPLAASPQTQAKFRDFHTWRTEDQPPMTVVRKANISASAQPRPIPTIVKPGLAKNIGADNILNQAKSIHYPDHQLFTDGDSKCELFHQSHKQIALNPRQLAGEHRFALTNVFPCLWQFPLVHLNLQCFCPSCLSNHLLLHVQLPSLSPGNMSPLQLPRKANCSGIQAETQVCLIMVGLPARGKSLIAGKGTFVASGVCCCPMLKACK